MVFISGIASQTEFFGAAENARPKDFDEFDKTAAGAIESLAEAFGIVKAEYSLLLSDEYLSTVNLPRKITIFDSFGVSDGEPVRFEYDFPQGGSIEFTVFTKKGRENLTKDEFWLLEIDFRQLYYIMSELVACYSIQSMIYTDYRTGVANVEAFMQFGARMIAEGKTSKYTALYFNIHNFKSVHRSLNYREGNEVLEKYCHIVADSVAGDELVARLGGDSFLALIYKDHKDYFFDLIQNMIVTYNNGEREFTFMFGATVGACDLSNEPDVGEIMMRISVAYQTAREQRVTMAFYDRKAGSSMIEQKIILSKFHRALANREFVVMYQPKVGVKDRTLLGAEALVRWHHGGGYIVPGSFIPVLENDGCICQLDFYVLDEVCRLQKRLADEGLSPVKISVNFSKRHLGNNKLVEEIAETIDKYSVPHEFLEIELTESENFHNQGVMKEIVAELNTLGIKTSIDDFGTGYSSLGMLRSLELDTLKIDRSFLPEVADNEDKAKTILMLKGVVNLAKSLGLKIVAEGVETPSQLALVESMECDMVQGYIFDKPLPEAEFVERIKRRTYELN